MTYNTEWGKRSGITVRLNMLVSSLEVRNVEKEDLSGKMEAIMRVILLMVIYKVMVRKFSISLNKI